jgi:elongation factor G
MKNGKVTGVVDVILRKAYKTEKTRLLKLKSASLADTLEEMHSVLAEAVAETSEEMMEKFFSGEAFTEEEIFTGLKNGVKDASIVPVLCGSGFLGIGTELLLNTAVNLLPSPADRPAQIGTNASGDPVEILADDNGQTCLFILKPFPTSTANSASSRC